MFVLQNKQVVCDIACSCLAFVALTHAHNLLGEHLTGVTTRKFALVTTLYFIKQFLSADAYIW